MSLEVSFSWVALEIVEYLQRENIRRMILMFKV